MSWDEKLLSRVDLAFHSLWCKLGEQVTSLAILIAAKAPLTFALGPLLARELGTQGFEDLQGR